MILIDQVARSYDGRPALRGVSLTVRPGEAVALVGPNGAGKSTMLRVIAGLIRPDAGIVSIDGVPVSDPRSRRSLGYLPQRVGVPGHTSLLSLARLVADLRGLPIRAVEQILDGAGLTHRRGATVAQLSGGQRQRFMLALATAGDVTALLLDEPGISLDTEGADEVHGCIRDARARGCSVLFASHHLHDVAALADRVAVMVEGTLIAEGTAPELARRAGLANHAPLETVYRTLVTRTRRPVREVA